MVPLADGAVERVGDFDLLAPTIVGGAAAKERGDFVPHGGGVVFVAGDGQAAGRKDVGHAVGEALAGGIELDDGEVGSAAAEVADEHTFGFCDARLIGEGRGDGFVLEMDLGEPGEHGGAVQAFLGELVLGGIGGEDGGAAHDDAFNVLAGDRVGAGFEISEEERDEFFDLERLVVNDCLGKRAERENRLDRLEKAAAHLVFDIAEFGGVADDGCGARRGGGEIQQRGIHPGDARIADEGARGGVPDGNRRIAGAEIDAVDKRVHELPGSGTRSRGRRRGEDEEEDAEILRVMAGYFVASVRPIQQSSAVEPETPDDYYPQKHRGRAARFYRRIARQHGDHHCQPAHYSATRRRRCLEGREHEGLPAPV